MRAIAWKVTGDRYRATTIAAGAGQILGGLLIALGLVEIFFVPGAFTGGLWLAFLGWFLSTAAGSEMSAAQVSRVLAARPLRRFTSRAVDPIPADTTIDDAIDGWFHVFDRDAFFVAEEPGPLVGVLTLDDVRRIRPDARDRVQVKDIMRPINDLPWLAAATPTSVGLDQLQADGVAVVFDDNEPIGLLTLRDVEARLRRDQELGRVPAVVHR